jgi:hypothetical protein
MLKKHPSNLRFVAAAADSALNRPSWNGCRGLILSGRRPGKGPCNAPRRDTDYARLTGVDVCRSRPDWNSRSRSEQEEDDTMREIAIHDYARQLLEAHGARAIAEAAQNAIELESKGNVEMARTWRHIEDAMKLMRGPHQS